MSGNSRQRRKARRDHERWMRGFNAMAAQIDDSGLEDVMLLIDPQFLTLEMWENALRRMGCEEEIVTMMRRASEERKP